MAFFPISNFVANVILPAIGISEPCIEVYSEQIAGKRGWGWLGCIDRHHRQARPMGCRQPSLELRALHTQSVASYCRSSFYVTNKNTSYPSSTGSSNPSSTCMGEKYQGPFPGYGSGDLPHHGGIFRITPHAP